MFGQNYRCWSVIVVLVVTTFGLSACADWVGEGEGEEEVNLVEGGPIFSASAERLTFSSGDVEGYESEQYLVIENLGDETLEIDNMRFSDDGGEAFQAGEDWFEDEPTLVEPGGQIEVSISYEPPNGDGQEGALVMDTNDPNLAVAEIELIGFAVAGHVEVSPREILFEGVPAGVAWQKELEVRNVGGGPLDVDDIALVEGEEYFWLESDGNLEFPVILPPGEDSSIVVDVYFEAADEEPVFGEIEVHTDDPIGEVVSVELAGNDPRPCLEIIGDDNLDFGPSPLESGSTRTVAFRNCSPLTNIEITSLKTVDDGGGVFSVEEAPAPLEDGEGLVLEPGVWGHAIVGYEPTAEGSDQGVLEIKTAEEDIRLEWALAGQGVDGICPVAVAGASPSGTPDYSAELVVEKFGIISLSADGSYDPDGGPLTYEWAVIERPTGSSAGIEGSTTSPQTELDIDLVGDYVVELTVVDDQGLKSCSPALVEIELIADGDIVVEMSWSTPVIDKEFGGPDGSQGIGTDMDMHYVHPDAYWGDSMSVNWLQRTGQWAEHGVVSLEIDDGWGEYPERLFHDNPKDGAFYRVGVHFYDSKGYGVAYATVRVFFHGELYGSYHHQMLDTDSFWYVGNVEWSDEPTFDHLDIFQTTIAELTSAADIFGG